MKSFSYIVRVAIALTALVFPPLTVAQQGGQTGTTGSGDSTGTKSKQPAEKKPADSPPGGGNNSFILITGNVILEDGTAPPLQTSIVRDCGASVSTDAYVDPSGHFSIQLGGSSFSNGAIRDADESVFAPLNPLSSLDQSRLGNPAGPSVSLMACELRAKAEGYQSTVVRFDVMPSLGELDVGTIILHPTSKGGAAVSITSLQAPKGARKSLQEARNAVTKGDFAKAEESLKKAIAVYPEYAEAWLNLGRLCENQQRVQEAKDAYGRAVEADDDVLAAYLQLARLEAFDQRWTEMASITDRAVANDSFDSPEAFFYNAIAHYNLGDLEAAEISSRRVVQLDIRHQIPDIHLILARILARRNDTEGWQEELNNYLRYAPSPPDVEAIRSQLVKLQDTAYGSLVPSGNP